MRATASAPYENIRSERVTKSRMASGSPAAKQTHREVTDAGEANSYETRKQCFISSPPMQ